MACARNGKDKQMIFKTQELEKEWEKLKDDVKCIVLEAETIAKSYNLDICITCIFRDDQDQKRLYDKLKKPYIPTLHSWWKACDFGLRGDGDKMACRMAILSLNKKYSYGNKNIKKSIIFHDIGAGEHFHIQQPLA